MKAHEILDLLPEFGVADKKTHSSSLDKSTADKVRSRLGGTAPKESDSLPELDLPTRERPRPKPKPAAAPGPGPAAVPRIPTGGGVAPVFRPPLQGARPVKPPVAQPPKPPVQAKPAAPASEPGAKRPAPPAPPAPPQAPAPPAPTGPAAKAAPAQQEPAKPIAPGPPPAPPQAPVRPAAPGAPAPPAPRIPRAPAERPQKSAQPLRRAVPGGPPQQTAKPPRAQPGAPVRPPVAGGGATPGRPAPGAPQPQQRRSGPPPGGPRGGGPGRPQQRPAPARPQANLAPNQPIYRRPQPPGPVPGMPTQRPGGPIPGRPQPGGAPGRPDSRRPRPGGAGRPRSRPRRDPEAERESKILQQQRAARAAQATLKAKNTEIVISEGATVKELAEKLGIKANVLIKSLVERGLFATINQTLDMEMIRNLCKQFGASVEELSFEEETTLETDLSEDPSQLQPRAPVVTVMGHVDHGKTSLLDALRDTRVADREAGGITQAIGASQIEHDGRNIVFVDTPGHEAFTRMRAHGAKVTDVVILVVAADDGVMPQTLEAMDHAKAAGVPIVVAVNKIDKSNAQPDRVKQQLSDRGLMPEEWGGDTVFVNVSAIQRTNLDQLLEMVLLTADLRELKANPNRAAVGTVLESKLDRGQGPVATVIVQNGTLRVGDYFVVGSVFGRVRALIDHVGEKIDEAGPSTPVLVLGLEDLPQPGDQLTVVTDTDRAKKIVEHREQKEREQALAASSRLSLEQFQDKLKRGEVRELPIVLKADVQGSLDVLEDMLRKLKTDKVAVQIVRTGVGAISESDVLLAITADAIIIGFNVRPERSAAVLAEREKVEIRLHTVIYELADELKKALAGLLAPVIKEEFQGRATVKEVFHVSKIGTVAGCLLEEGKATSTSKARLLRDNIVVYTGKLSSLRRFKDDVSEVRAGQECGITLHNYNDIKQGDEIELFHTIEVAQELEL